MRVIARSQKRSTRLHAALALLLCLTCLSASAQLAQAQVIDQSNPVYVDQSPRAHELFARALSHAADNEGEAARLFMELLDDYATTVIPVDDGIKDHYISVRQRVHDTLRAQPRVLNRYQLLAEAGARRQLNAGQLQQLARARSLTTPGLEALLHLGQQHLEHGHFIAAQKHLDEALQHPNINTKQKAHALYMNALAAHHQGNTDKQTSCQRTLEQLGRDATTLLEDLNVRLAEDGADRAANSQTVTDHTTIGSLDDLVADAIWTVDLDQTMVGRGQALGIGDGASTAAFLQSERINAGLATAAVAIRKNAVYVNEGFRIRSLDRYTGHENWRFFDTSRRSSSPEDFNSIFDLNLISVTNNTLVTLTGHAQARKRSRGGGVLCLDANNGTIRWRQQLNGIGDDEDHIGLFPCGQPLIRDGLVLILARKVSDQRLTSTYVIALDEEHGHLRWSRYVNSSGGVGQAIRPTTSLLDGGDAIYVSSPVGSISRIDITTGNVQWLRTFSIPVRSSMQAVTRRAWEFSMPALTKRGLVTVIRDQSTHRLLLLDAKTGQSIEEHPAGSRTAWDAPRYLLSDDSRVYAIGQTIRAFDATDLARPLWQLPVPEGIEISVIDGERRLPAPEEVEPLNVRGRVQLAGDMLVIPTGADVRLIDVENGIEATRLDIPIGGNPVTIGAQLFLCGVDRLDTYMSFALARNMLLQRLDQEPDDISLALSLVRLGHKGNDVDLALSATRTSLDIIERLEQAERSTTDGMRRELFTLLRSLATDKPISNVEQGEELFALIADVGTTPNQAVLHHLIYADWLALHDPQRAIDVLQNILTDDVLGSVRYIQSDLIRSAGDWASRRIATIMRDHGPETYDNVASQATAALDSASTAAQRRLAIAQFPQARAAWLAACESARDAAARGDIYDGAALLTSTYMRHPVREAAAILMGTYIDLCVDADWHRQAHHTARQMKHRFGDITLTRQTGAQHVDDVLNELDSNVPKIRYPVLGSHEGFSRLLRGRLLEVEPAARLDRNPDIALLTDGASIFALDAKDLTEQWRTPVNDLAPRVIGAHQGNLIIWLGGDPEDQRAISIDADTGKQRWSTPRLSETHILGNSKGQVRRLSPTTAILPSGIPFRPRQTLPVVQDDKLVLVQRTGGIVAFDLVDANEPTWIMPDVLTEVHHVASTEDALILAGVRDATVDPMGGGAHIVVLNINDGSIRIDHKPEIADGILWMQPGPMATLVYGTVIGLDAISLMNGMPHWARIGGVHSDLDDSWAADEHVLFRDDLDQIRSIAWEGGRMNPAFDTLVRTDWNQVDPSLLRSVEEIDGELYALYSARLLRYEEDGRITGADVLTADRDFRNMIPGTDRIFLVSADTQRAQFHEGRGRTVEHEYRVFAVSRDGRLIDDALQLPPQIEPMYTPDAINGWVLLGFDSHVFAVPMPAK